MCTKSKQRSLHLSNKDVDGGDEVGIANMMLREEHEGNHNEPQTSHLEDRWLLAVAATQFSSHPIWEVKVGRPTKLNIYMYIYNYIYIYTYILHEIKLKSQNDPKSLAS